MSRFTKTLEAILRGDSDTNIQFNDLRNLLLKLGFSERVKGSHRILWHEGIPEILNLQPNGSEAKPYQVKQVRELIFRHRLAGRHNDEE